VEDVRAVALPLARRGIEGEHDVLARPISRLLDGLQDDLDGLFVGA
jgi:hypothetical protein